MNSKLKRVTNQSTYPAQPKNPAGEVHEDEGIISFDRTRQKLVLRQFHIEGFVTQYVEDVGSSPERVSFTSEQLEEHFRRDGAPVRRMW